MYNLLDSIDRTKCVLWHQAAVEMKEPNNV